jgi:hypothetical protein|tara:strand:+ start:350 stop:511 length:162 start_codon:yes stop_codon:yes gene_type:complete
MPLDLEGETLILNTLLRHEKLIDEQFAVIKELQTTVAELIEILQENVNVRSKS